MRLFVGGVSNALITDMQIRALPPPAKGQKIYLDDGLDGFGIRVSPGGTKTFVITFGADRRRITIGRWPVLPLAKPRRY